MKRVVLVAPAGTLDYCVDVRRYVEGERMKGVDWRRPAPLWPFAACGTHPNCHVDVVDEVGGQAPVATQQVFVKQESVAHSFEQKSDFQDAHNPPGLFALCEVEN